MTPSPPRAVPVAAVLAALGILALPAGIARAHGQYPQSVAGLWPPGAEAAPWIQTTFGVLIPQGRDWRWLCEEIVPLADMKTLAIDANGRWVVGGVYGVQTSLDGCDWESPESAVSGLYVSQVAVDRADDAAILVSTSTAGAHNALYRTTDGGRTFTEVHAFGGAGATPTIRGFLQGEGGLPLFAVAWDGGVPSLWHSPDGVAWTAHEITSREEGSVYPLAIDPTDPAVAWLRVDLDNGGAASQRQRLLRATADGTFTPVLDLADALTAFAVSPDGALLEVGGRYVGMYRSTDGGRTFDGPELSPEAGCLSYVDGVRFQCANNYADEAAMLRGPRGAGEPVMVFGQVSAPLDCPEESDFAAYCLPLWPEIKAFAGLGLIPPPTPTPAPTPTPGAEGGCGGRGGDAAGAGVVVILALGAGLGRARARSSGAVPGAALTVSEKICGRP